MSEAADITLKLVMPRAASRAASGRGALEATFFFARAAFGGPEPYRVSGVSLYLRTAERAGMMFSVHDPFHSDADHRHAATIAAIQTALASADDIDASAITASMADGMVVLEGAAPTERDIDRAMEIAALIAGGLVRNRIWRRG